MSTGKKNHIRSTFKYVEESFFTKVAVYNGKNKIKMMYVNDNFF